MTDTALENAAPKVYVPLTSRPLSPSALDASVRDPVDAREIFDLIRDLNDPEHPLTLEQLGVVSLEQVTDAG